MDLDDFLVTSRIITIPRTEFAGRPQIGRPVFLVDGRFRNDGPQYRRVGFIKDLTENEVVIRMSLTAPSRETRCRKRK